MKSYKLLIDMDSFFASVEQVENPALKGKAVVICNNMTDRGVVSTASYEARKYGIKSAMSYVVAKSLAGKDVIFIKGNHNLYKRYSIKVRKIISSFTDKFEALSIDEFLIHADDIWLIYDNIISFAADIKKKILNESGLSCSIGISNTSFIAKMASQLAKPGGIVKLSPREYLDAFKDHSVKDLIGVGKSTYKRLFNMGIKTIGQLANANIRHLKEFFGMHGIFLHKAARGIINDEEYIKKTSRKSISNETTFETDISDINTLSVYLRELAEQISYRADIMQAKGNRITLKVKYFDFTSTSRSMSINTHTNDPYTIYKTARSMLTGIITKPLRLIGIALENITQENQQQSIFNDSKREKFIKTMHILNQRYSNIIKPLSTIKPPNNSIKK